MECRSPRFAPRGETRSDSSLIGGVGHLPVSRVPGAVPGPRVRFGPAFSDDDRSLLVRRCGRGLRHDANRWEPARGRAGWDAWRLRDAHRDCGVLWRHRRNGKGWDREGVVAGVVVGVVGVVGAAALGVVAIGAESGGATGSLEEAITVAPTPPTTSTPNANASGIHGVRAGAWVPGFSANGVAPFGIVTVTAAPEERRAASAWRIEAAL